MTTLTRGAADGAWVGVFRVRVRALEPGGAMGYGRIDRGTNRVPLPPMTDTLLTIDEATRAFRTSPKTIRRRLAAGEIEGAYKRPGDRGPEWVMPAGSLVAAGFPLRPGADTPALPEDQAELAAYWERRAIDAESAGQGRPEPEVDRPSWWRLPVLIGGLVLVALAFIAGQVTASDGGDAAQQNSELVRTLLVARTQADEAIGVVGVVPDDVVPDGRRVRELDAGGLPDEVPRYVVSALRDGWAPPTVQDLRSSAAVLLALPGDGIDGMQVFDTRSPARSAADDDAPADSPTPAPDATPTTPTAPVPTPSGIEPDQPAEEAVDPSGAGARDASTPPAVADEVLHTVGAGDSFWRIAADVVSANGVTNPDAVARYWAALLDANADRLVEPGNPDLLHVGQVLFLPPAA